MDADQKIISETENVKIELTGADWKLKTVVSVTKAPMAAKDLLPTVQALADKVVEYATKSVEEGGKKISCRKGCGACCRQLVPISEVEARRIRDVVNEMPEPRRSEIGERFAEARRRLEKSGLLEKLLYREHWSEEEVQPLGVQYFFQGIPCPFLQDESCSIYADRPLSCREYLVTSPAENCARPSKENINQVELPFRIWPALARLENPARTGRFIPWVPLILAPEWADSHSEEPMQRPGSELLREVFEYFSGSKQSNDQARTVTDKKRAITPAAYEEDSQQSVNPSSFPAADSWRDQSIPLRIASLEDFERANAMFRDADYDDATICRMFDIQDMSDIGSGEPGKMELSSRLALLLRIFLFLQSIPKTDVEPWLESDLLACLQKLDLIRMAAPNPENAQRVYYCPVWLYPVAGFLIASDRRTNPDGSQVPPMPDIVFPAIYEGSLDFLAAISSRSADDALDLCSGSGIGAMVLSRSAKRVLASDITPRACHFAKFNVLLNRRLNIEVAKGDLYEAVGARTFDLIVAHPPYVPAIDEALIYRNSGETGETLLSRIVSGLPQYLRSGGAFVSVCGGWDSREGGFEERARRWIGECKDDFRVSFTPKRELSVEEVACRLPTLDDSQMTMTSADWLRILQANGLEKRVYGTLVIERSRSGKLN